MADKPLSKVEQVAALRKARAGLRSNPFEDAARGRDVAKSSGGGGKPTEVLQPPVPVRIRPLVPKADVQATVSGAVQRLGPPETKRGRPRIGEVREKPWIAAGMSERTWYRRQREQRK